MYLKVVHMIHALYIMSSEVTLALCEEQTKTEVIQKTNELFNVLLIQFTNPVQMIYPWIRFTHKLTQRFDHSILAHWTGRPSTNSLNLVLLLTQIYRMKTSMNIAHNNLWWFIVLFCVLFLFLKRLIAWRIATTKLFLLCWKSKFWNDLNL